MAGAETLTAKSDCVLDSNEDVDELLPGTGSVVEEMTDAVLLIVVSQATFGLSLTVNAKFVKPVARVAMLQVIAPVPPTEGVAQVQPAGDVRDWKVVLFGVAPVKVTAVAAVAAVLFVTVILKVVLAPAMAGGTPVVETERSVPAPTTPVTVVLPFAIALFEGKPGKVPTILAT